MNSKPVHTIQVNCYQHPNVFHLDGLHGRMYKIVSTSSEKENCGLESLRLAKVINNDFLNCREKYLLPLNGRLSQEEIANVLTKYHSYALLVIEVHYNQMFETDTNGNVLIDSYGLTLFAPSVISNTCGCMVILNDHGHFSPIFRKDEQIIVPKDIIETIKCINGNNYDEMCKTIFSDFHTPCMRVTAQLRSVFNF